MVRIGCILFILEFLTKYKLVDISFNKKHHSWIIIGFILGITWSTEVGKHRKDVTEGSMYLICFLKHQNFIIIYQILKMHSFKDCVEPLEPLSFFFLTRNTIQSFSPNDKVPSIFYDGNSDFVRCILYFG